VSHGVNGAPVLTVAPYPSVPTSKGTGPLSAGSAASPAAFSVPVVPAIDPDDTSVSPKSVEGYS